MYWPQLLALMLFTAGFGLAARLEQWHAEGTSRSSMMSLLFGDSRRLFANHIYAKADAYFHSGYYPSMFDGPKPEGDFHMGEAADRHEDHSNCGHEHHAGEVCEHGDEHKNEQDKASDAHGAMSTGNWIENFGRHFYPSEHTHMEDTRDEREILPWLKLTADLDPHKVETYVVAAYTLRKKLGKPREAEEFLRRGLRENPESFEILIELGRINSEDHHDIVKARNLWELALEKWNKQHHAGGDPDVFALAQILGSLANLEERQGNWPQAIKHLEALKDISPYKKDLEKQIAELRQKPVGP